MHHYLTACQQLLFNVSSETLEKDSTQFELLHVSQEIRSKLSTQAFVLVLLVAIVYTWALWDQVNATLLLIWSVTVTITAAHRASYCRGLLRRLDTATAEQLLRHEFYLFANGVVYGLVIGSAYWFIAAYGDDRTVFAITLMSCMYAIGTTANSSIHFRTFTVFTLLNLGQGIIFFAIDSHKVDIPIMMTIVVMIILLLRFGHRNSELFEKSVRRRLENVAQNEVLKAQKAKIEHSLEIVNQANMSKSRFLAAASHDLRQPLHAISLFLGSLRNTQTTEQQQELLEYIQQSSDTLNSQFNSLLDLSQFDSGNININVVSFDLHAMVKRMVNSMSLEAKEKNLALTYSGQPVTLESDPILFDRVVRNLITNALKYTDTGSVWITVEPTNDHVLLSVSDTGYGIATADLKLVFEEFTQINNPERGKNKGAGLGLAIVWRITQLLDIEVKVDSELGTGSTFKLIIPLHNRLAGSENTHANSTANETQALYGQNTKASDKALLLKDAESTDSESDDKNSNAAGDEFDLTGLNILVVDDDRTILSGFEQLLIQKGASVIACQSHSEAMATPTPTQIDFAFLDDMLAGPGTGLDVANWLGGYIEKQRIIMVTGSEKPQRIQEIRSAGFSVYTKPLTPPLLDSIFLSRYDLLHAKTS